MKFEESNNYSPISMEENEMLTNVKKNIRITGNSEIDGTVVEGYQCEIDSNKPSEMNHNSWVANKLLYKGNRDQCYKDRAEFENTIYELQDQMLKDHTLNEVADEADEIVE